MLYVTVFILSKRSLRTVFPERCLASFQEITKSNEKLGDNKSNGREGQPGRIAIKMLRTYVALLFETDLKCTPPATQFPLQKEN